MTAEVAFADQLQGLEAEGRLVEGRLGGNDTELQKNKLGKMTDKARMNILMIKAMERLTMARSMRRTMRKMGTTMKRMRFRKRVPRNLLSRQERR